MQPLSENDLQHLQAATGWIELGNWPEANEELENVEASRRAHPDVLRLRWRVYKMAGKWDGALAIAQALAKLEPDDEYGWLCLAASYHGMGKTAEAYQTLVGVMNEFSGFAVVPYRAACYACALGKLADAKKWLAVALDNGGDNLKLQALDDDDLQPLWKHIGNL